MSATLLVFACGGALLVPVLFVYALARRVVATHPRRARSAHHETLVSGWPSSPSEVSDNWTEVPLGPTANDGAAWYFPAPNPSSHWSIHVQGIRTSRLVTLRTVAVLHETGAHALTVTFPGAGDGPRQRGSSLGLTEWTCVLQAIRFARRSGAQRVTLVAWSMGTGLALSAARAAPELVDDVVLICPAISWRNIIEHGARRARLPVIASYLTVAALKSPYVSRLIGMPAPVDVDELDWSKPGRVLHPTLVIHSRGDDVIPFSHSRRFFEAHSGLVRLVETTPAPHGREADVDPTTFRSAIQAHLKSTYLDTN